MLNCPRLRAEFERDLIRALTGENRQHPQARGVRMGRPPKLTHRRQREAIKQRERGDPLTEIGGATTSAQRGFRARRRYGGEAGANAV